MKILAIVGSPRVDGNTHFLAQKFAEGARMGGAEEVEEVFLSKLNIHPCVACYHCGKRMGLHLCG
jgi:multimeric flavodoxin WrbA